MSIQDPSTFVYEDYQDHHGGHILERQSLHLALDHDVGDVVDEDDIPEFANLKPTPPERGEPVFQ